MIINHLLQLKLLILYNIYSLEKNTLLNIYLLLLFIIIKLLIILLSNINLSFYKKIINRSKK